MFGKGRQHRASRWLVAAVASGLLGAAGGQPALAGSVPAETGAARTASSEMTAGPACVPALAGGSQTVTLDLDGVTRDIIIHLPEGDTLGRLPAVVAFHGFTSYATALESVSGLSIAADEHGFVAAYPQALDRPTEWHYSGHRGYDQRDIAMTRSLLRLLIEQACVDPGRIVLAGHSMGGGMASDAACRLADLVAGVVLVAALWFELPCQPVRAVPVVAVHALDDPLLPYAGGSIGAGAGVPDQLPVEEAVGAWAAHDGCGTTPRTTPTDEGAMLTWSDCHAPVVLHRLSQGGHDWPTIASELIVELVAST